MYYISVSEGILDQKHYRKMLLSRETTCLWIYLWLLNKITKIDEKTGLGTVLGGKPIKIKDLKMFGNRKTLMKIIKKLREENYIQTIRTPYGYSIFITKAKKIFNRKVNEREVPSVGYPEVPSVGYLRRRSYVVDNNSKTIKQIADLQITFLFILYQQRIRKTIILNSDGKEKCGKALSQFSFRDLILAIYNKSIDDWWMREIAPKWSFAKFLSHKNKLTEYAQINSVIPDTLFNKPELSDLLKKIRELKNEPN